MNFTEDLLPVRFTLDGEPATLIAGDCFRIDLENRNIMFWRPAAKDAEDNRLLNFFNDDKTSLSGKVLTPSVCEELAQRIASLAGLAAIKTHATDTSICFRLEIIHRGEA